MGLLFTAKSSVTSGCVSQSVSMSVQLLSERVMANDSASPAYLASDWLLGII